MAGSPEKNRGGNNRKKKAPGREEAAPMEAVAPLTTSASAATTAHSISSTDLYANVGRVLADVEAGGSWTVTHYNVPVAQISPIGAPGETQADLMIVGSPAIRPTQQVDPMRAQRRRDELLSKINTSKRRG